MIDTCKPCCNSFGEVSADIRMELGLIHVTIGLHTTYFVSVDGKADRRYMDEKFDIFNVPSQKEKAMKEITKYNDELGTTEDRGTFSMRFPKILKIIQNLKD